MDRPDDPRLGLDDGEAHVIRNAGGVITDDEIRSLAISQRLLGTTEIILIHHTDCGMIGFRDDEFRRQLHAETGTHPTWDEPGFIDIDDDVRRSIERVRSTPFLPARQRVRGFVFDVDTGRHLGNFPQAFSHLALIEAASRIIVAERLAEFS